MENNEETHRSHATSNGILNRLGSLFEPSDEQAMWRLQSNDDPEAFAVLFRRWEPPIRRLCFRMLQDQHKAEDLAQEAFSRIFARRKDFNHGSKFSTFLWRVTVNLCLDELRRVKRRREFSLIPGRNSDDLEETTGELPAEDKSPQELTGQDEEALLVRRALQQIPEHYRAVLVLRHYEDLKFREIADVLEIPIGTVKSRMAEGLGMLQRILTRQLNAKPTPRINPGCRELVL